MRQRRLGPMMMFVSPLRPLPGLLTLAALTLALPAAASSPARFAAAAEARVGSPKPLLRNDCSGLVMTVLDEVGAPHAGNTHTYWADAEREGRVRSGRPEVGDLAFFDRTWDANRNGRVDDELSHIAIVVDVDDDGTVHLIHRGGKAVTGLTLHLVHKDRAKLDGRKINSYLRAPGYGPKGGPRLAGQLVRGFARPPLGETMLASSTKPDKASKRDVALSTTRSGRPKPAAKQASSKTSHKRVAIKTHTKTAKKRSSKAHKKTAKRSSKAHKKRSSKAHKKTATKRSSKAHKKTATKRSSKAHKKTAKKRSSKTHKKTAKKRSDRSTAKRSTPKRS